MKIHSITLCQIAFACLFPCNNPSSPYIGLSKVYQCVVNWRRRTKTNTLSAGYPMTPGQQRALQTSSNIANHRTHVEDLKLLQRQPSFRSYSVSIATVRPKHQRTGRNHMYEIDCCWVHIVCCNYLGQQRLSSPLPEWSRCLSTRSSTLPPNHYPLTNQDDSLAMPRDITMITPFTNEQVKRLMTAIDFGLLQYISFLYFLSQLRLTLSRTIVSRRGSEIRRLACSIREGVYKQFKRWNTQEPRYTIQKFTSVIRQTSKWSWRWRPSG